MMEVEPIDDVTNRFKAVRVGFWVHFRDRETGEGWWQWDPPRVGAINGRLFVDPAPPRE